MDKKRRIVLRPLRTDDLDSRVAMCSRPEVQRLMTGSCCGEKATMSEMLQWFIARTEEQDSIQFAIEYSMQSRNMLGTG